MEGATSIPAQSQDARRATTQGDELALGANSSRDVERYEGRLYGGKVEAVPGRSDGHGQRVWTVTATTEDGRQAQVQAKLTGQFGPEHLTPESYVKQALDRQIGPEAAAPAEGEELDNGAEDGSDNILGRLAATAAPEFFVGQLEIKDTGSRQVMVDITNPTTVIDYHAMPGKITSAGFQRIEVTEYSMAPDKADVIEREHGLQKSWEFGPRGDEGDVTINVRGGDSTIRSPEDGAAVVFSVGGLELISELASRQKTSTILNKAGGGMNTLLDRFNADVALAWKGEFVRDSQTGKMYVEFGEFRMNWEEFLDHLPVAAQEYDPVNQGQKEIARANNIEAYFDGANPFDRAVQTREGNQFVNHGDPIADIAARLIKLGQITDTYTGESDYVRTNAGAEAALKRAAAMYERPAIDSRAEDVWQKMPADERPSLDGPRLTPEQKAHFESTMSLLHEYGIAGLYGNDIADLAAEIHANASDDLPGQQLDNEFVQNVFEGQFRGIPEDGVYGNPVVNLALDALSLKVPAVGAVLTAYEVGKMIHGAATWDPSEIEEPVREGITQGLLTRLEENHGGVLAALGIEAPAGANESQLEQLKGQALAALLYELQHNQIDGVRATQAQTYYEAFRGLSQDERRAIGESVVDGEWETGQWRDQ